MNLAQLLNVAAFQSFNEIKTGSCPSESQLLISCLHNEANFTKYASEQCLFCTVAASEDQSTGEQSSATMCDEFEAGGYCGNLNQCFRNDCSNKCRDEYRTWAMCVFDDIGCPLLCRRKKGMVDEIAWCLWVDSMNEYDTTTSYLTWFFGQKKGRRSIIRS